LRITDAGSGIRIIETTKHYDDSVEDPLQLSEQIPSYGRTGLAWEIFEKAIIEASARVELHQALLEGNRHARETQRIKGSWHRLK
jgi:hypothetical protein